MLSMKVWTYIKWSYILKECGLSKQSNFRTKFLNYFVVVWRIRFPNFSLGNLPFWYNFSWQWARPIWLNQCREGTEEQLLGEFNLSQTAGFGLISLNRPFFWVNCVCPLPLKISKMEVRPFGVKNILIFVW